MSPQSHTTNNPALPHYGYSTSESYQASQFLVQSQLSDYHQLTENHQTTQGILQNEAQSNYDFTITQKYQPAHQDGVPSDNVNVAVNAAPQVLLNVKNVQMSLTRKII